MRAARIIALSRALASGWNGYFSKAVQGFETGLDHVVDTNLTFREEKDPVDPVLQDAEK